MHKPAEVLQWLHLAEARYRMEQLDASRSMGRSPVQKEEEAAAARMLDGFFDKLNHSLAAEARDVAETEISCNPIEHESEFLLVKFVEKNW